MSFDTESGYFKQQAPVQAPMQMPMQTPGYYPQQQQQQQQQLGGFVYGAPPMGRTASPLGSAPVIWIIVSVLEFVIAPFGVLSILGILFAVLAYSKNESGEYESAAKFLMITKYICILHLIMVVLLFCFAFCLFGVLSVVAVSVPVAAAAGSAH